MKIRSIRITVALVLTCIGWGAAYAADTVTAAEARAAAEIDRAREYFSNVELINQDGETVRFFDDVLKDQVVVINFIFTNCDGACPLMTHKLSIPLNGLSEKKVLQSIIVITLLIAWKVRMLLF